LSVLAEAYLPPTLPGRNEEMAELRRCLHPFTRHRPVKNIWLHGPPGSGKTSAAKLLLDEMEQKHGIRVVYINCWEAQTFHAFLDRATRDLRIFGAERLSAVFKMERLEKATGSRRLLVVLDKFDIPSPRERDAIIYNLCGMPRLALLCISNSRQFYYSLDSRARSRLARVSYIGLKNRG
jgi:cell division control protein 6